MSDGNLLNKKTEHCDFIRQFSGTEDLSVLQQRTEQFVQEDNADKLSEEEYIHFRLGGTESYAVNYRYVEEILNPNNITRVPCVPKHVAGVVNRRSSLLAVYDLKQLFSLNDPKEKNDEVWVIVVTCDDANYSACILADEIYANENYVVEHLAAPLKSTGIKNLAYVKGIIDGRITLLDIPAILSDENLKVVKNAA
ncbi:MAG: chemotaxis protein CheW [Coxiellaceae bacterium]|nr:chemotaxis protein CheW [Coxiellaceae bacterium]